jgi:GAF domain-containing protein
MLETSSIPEAVTGLTGALTDEVCDWAAVDLFEDEGYLRRVAHAHRDDAKKPLLEKLKREYPPGVSPNLWAKEVLATGKPIFAFDITEEKIRDHTGNPGFARLVCELGIHSCALFPLFFKSKPVGALTLVNFRAESAELEELASAASRVCGAWLELQAMSRQLKLREQFVSIAAHELKTPLTSIQALIQLMLLQEHRGTPMDSERKVKILEKA